MKIVKLNLPFKTKLLIIGCLMILVLYYTTKASLSTTRASQSSASNSPLKTHQPANTKSTKKILMWWNNYYEVRINNYDFSRPLFEDFHCEVTNCQVWNAKDGMPDIPVEDFDLVWFHGLPSNKLWPTRPQVRKPNQVYLFFLYEAPATHLEADYRHLTGFFNWTATYRVNSDIYTPYGWFINKTLEPVLFSKPDTNPMFIQPRFDNITTQVAAKTKLIYWLVSNCNNIPSKRDVYTKKLSLHIPVDIFGKCGTPCTGNMCDHDVLVKSYKFYLAFENSICKDYITEKFFDITHYDVVPVVLGGGDYARFAPPHSYIDTRDFESPRHLAEYLHFLAGNDTEYRKYFWWKDYYVHGGFDQGLGSVHVLCTMCALLNNPPPPKVVDDLQGWWKAGGECGKMPSRLLRPVTGRFEQDPRLRILPPVAGRFHDPYVIGFIVVCLCISVIVIVLLKNTIMIILGRIWPSPCFNLSPSTNFSEQLL